MNEETRTLRESIAIQLHLFERILAKVTLEISPINCSWGELTEDFKESYRFNASRILFICQESGLKFVVDIDGGRTWDVREIDNEPD